MPEPSWPTRPSPVSPVLLACLVSPLPLGAGPSPPIPTPAIQAAAQGAQGVQGPQGPGNPPGPPEEGAARLERFRAYLDRNPYGDRALEGLVENARALGAGALPDLIRGYRRRLEADPGDRPARVVLARLLAAEERWDEAARLLAHGPEGARGRRVLAQVLTSAGRLEEAHRALEEARRSTDDADLLGQLLVDRAEVDLLRGDRAAARGAYRELADLDRGDFAHLDDVAGQLAAADFVEDAIELYGEAAALAGDVARRCRVLSERGRLHERAHQGRQALACYAEAMALMSRGHWLREELSERSLILHRRAGTLGQAQAALRAALGADPGDLEARLDLVRALELDHRPRQALAELRRASGQVPGDLQLSDRLVAGLTAVGEDRLALAELQRALALAPGDPRRRFALGAALARTGDLSGAQREWQRLLDQAGDDPALADRVARAWIEHGEPRRAIALLEQGIDLAPRQVRRYGDLARLLVEVGETEGARLVLGRAEAAVAGLGAALDELSALYLTLGEAPAARRTLQAAQRADPRSGERLARLADLALEVGDREGALACLTRWLEAARDPHQRALALEGYTRLFEGQGAEAERARLSSLVAAGPGERAPYLLLAEFERQRADLPAAARVLTRLLEGWPDDLAARQSLVAALEQTPGWGDGALTQLEELLRRDPARAPVYLLRQAELLIAQGADRSRPLGRLAAARARLPRDAGTWRDLARVYEDLSEAGAAADCLHQALRIDPSSARAHLDLGRLARAAGRRVQAFDSYQAAWRAGDGGLRARALGAMHALLGEGGQLERQLRALRLSRRRNPFDSETPRMLAELSLLDGDHQGALRVLDDLLRREPDAVDLLRTHARACVAMGRHGSSLRDLRRLAALGQGIDELVAELVGVVLARKEVGHAMELGALADDPVAVGRKFLSAGRPRSGIDYLERRARGCEAPVPALFLLLAELHDQLDHKRQAIRALRAYEQRVGPSWTTSERIGTLWHGLRDEHRALEYGRRMFELGAPPDVLERYFEGHASRAELTRLRCGHVLESATDAAAVEEGLRGLLEDRTDAQAALDLVRELRQRGDDHELFPAQYGLGAWSQYLDTWVLRLYHRNPHLVGPRLDELEPDRRALSRTEWVEVLMLEHFPGSERSPEVSRSFRRLAGPRPDPAERAVRRYPASPRVLYAAARWARLEGLEERAAAYLGSLVEELAAEEHLRRGAHLRRVAFAAHAAEVLAVSPPHPELWLGSPLLERLARLDFRPPAEDLRVVCSRQTAIALHGRSLARLGRRREARRTLEALAEPHPEALAQWIDRARLMLAVGLTREAGEALVRAGRNRARVEREARLAPFRAWREGFDEDFRRVAWGLWLRLWRIPA